MQFHLIDIRDLNGERLLAGANTGDNVLGTWTRLGEQPTVVRRILAQSPPRGVETG